MSEEHKPPYPQVDFYDIEVGGVYTHWPSNLSYHWTAEYRFEEGGPLPEKYKRYFSKDFISSGDRIIGLLVNGSYAFSEPNSSYYLVSKAGPVVKKWWEDEDDSPLVKLLKEKVE